MQPTKVVCSTNPPILVKRHLGKAYVKVEYSGLQHSLPVVVIKDGTSALFGRNWLTYIKLGWKNLPGLNDIGLIFPSASASQENPTLDSVLQQYDELFLPELGCYTGEPFVSNESKGAKFHKARAVLYAFQSKVNC